MKIGLIDIDTSHPENWIPLLRARGHEIVALYDGGDVHPAEYVEKFAQTFGIPRICQTLEEMVPLIDGVILHGCDWDKHLAKATPFLESGKSVLIDKPMAGNLRDIAALIEWEKRGAVITGGSALRYAAEAEAFLAQPVEQRGEVDTMFCGCAVDLFNYGIHAYALACTIMGPGLIAARYLGHGVQDRVELQWAGGRTAYLAIGKIDNWLPSYATVVTTKSVTSLVVDVSKLYESLLDSVLPVFSRQRSAPLTLRQVLEPELGALAALKSKALDGEIVRLDSLALDDPGYDGDGFVRGYRLQRYPDS